MISLAMDFQLALRLCEILTGFALALQCAEHLARPTKYRLLHSLRLTLCVCLLAGLQTPIALPALLITGLYVLRQFNGPYNGGSDRMGLLILFCLSLARAVPHPIVQEGAFAYLGLQLLLSYFAAGFVKLKNPEWRNGRALADLLQFSVYPVSESVRSWSQYSNPLKWASRAVIFFELAFPFTLAHPLTLHWGLVIAAGFHLANALTLGLNRFFWIWIAAFPSLLWMQQRFFL